jgi:hypothetical protein
VNGIFETLQSVWDHDLHAITQHPHTSAATATAAPTISTRTTTGGPVSLATDAEQFYVNAKNELAKFETALPGLVAQAHKLEGNPLAEIALRAGEAVASQALPVEALAVAAKTVGSLVDDLISLYNPQTAAAPPAPVQ